MPNQTFKDIPAHIGVIPDGNRRWAVDNGLAKEEGYSHGLAPANDLLELCLEAGVKEVTFYGFTTDNTKRPAAQTAAFRDACVSAANSLSGKNVSLLVTGDTSSPVFPKELVKYSQKRHTFGKGLIKVNILVNYSWKWDIGNILTQESAVRSANINQLVASRDISRIDLIVRWGGRRRLSGFLPLQSVYADIYVIDAMWPDFKPEHFYRALEWYQFQDKTLGG